MDKGKPKTTKLELKGYQSEPGFLNFGVGGMTRQLWIYRSWSMRRPSLRRTPLSVRPSVVRPFVICPSVRLRRWMPEHHLLFFTQESIPEFIIRVRLIFVRRSVTYGDTETLPGNASFATGSPATGPISKCWCGHRYFLPPVLLHAIRNLKIFIPRAFRKP